ncbi:hypothetical protein DRN98_07870 [Methanosarcinales archaeon]|nr:MAG: hypothetical protein DRN98_07870 [Methanosarcinales archaeon]
MAEKRGGVIGCGIENKLIIKKAVSKKISQILEKAFISEREVYDLVRSFFKKYLGIDYEFTREELLDELRRVYIPAELQSRVESLFNDISKIEHTSKAFPREELERILVEFEGVVDDLIVSHYEKEKSFWKKLKDKVHHFFSQKHKGMLDIDESVLSENERVIVKMNMLLDNSKRLLNKDLGKAKEAYQELLELYNSLSEDRKKAYYKPVQELYNMIKTKQQESREETPEKTTTQKK